jgi:hypothetical protein
MRRRIAQLATGTLLATGLALGSLAGTAAAQDVGAPPPADRFDDDRDGMDWGWIGLFGLAGLAGLMGRERRTAFHAPQHPTAGRV